MKYGRMWLIMRASIKYKGRVKSLAREFKHMRRGEEITRQYKEERIINGTTDSRGNVYIILSSVRDGKQVMERRMLGQVVGTAFVDNNEKYTTIKHIDGDKSNNCVDNLKWVAWKDSNVGLKKRPVLCVTDNTTYPSVWECSRQCNVNRSTLQSHLRSGTPLNDKLYIYLDE